MVAHFLLDPEILDWDVLDLEILDPEILDWEILDSEVFDWEIRGRTLYFSTAAGTMNVSA